MRRSSMLHHYWLRNLKPGDEVVVIGDLLALSPKYKLRGVCLVLSKEQGVVCEVQEVSGEKIKIAETFFKVENGRARRNSARWGLKLTPPFKVAGAGVKELLINTRGG